MAVESRKELVHTAQVIQSDSAKARSELSTVSSEIDGVIAELRHFIAAEPSVDKPVELSSVLRALVQRAGTGLKTQVELHCDSKASARLSGTQAVELANIAREALSNSLRHGRPGRVEVSLRSEPQAVRLEIADDGAGFQPEAPARRGAGLRSMTVRAQELGGTLEIKSMPGKGTRVIVHLGVDKILG